MELKFHVMLCEEVVMRGIFCLDCFVVEWR